MKIKDIVRKIFGKHTSEEKSTKEVIEGKTLKEHESIFKFEQDGKVYDLRDLEPGFVITGDVNLRGCPKENFPDLSKVIVKGDFSCSGSDIKDLHKVPKEVGGCFDCSYCSELKDLTGAPQEVFDFSCEGCGGLKSLQGAPVKVDSFNCRDCENLETLKGAPKFVSKDFWCGACDKLTSLEGAPKKMQGCFDCGRCDNLVSLKGAPREVGSFICHNCYSLKSLEGGPEIVSKDFFCRTCTALTDLKGAPEFVGGNFDCAYTGISDFAGAPKEILGSFVYASTSCEIVLSGVPKDISIEKNIARLAAYKIDVDPLAKKAELLAKIKQKNGTDSSKTADVKTGKVSEEQKSAAKNRTEVAKQFMKGMRGINR